MPPKHALALPHNKYTCNNIHVIRSFYLVYLCPSARQCGAYARPHYNPRIGENLPFLRRSSPITWHRYAAAFCQLKYMTCRQTEVEHTGTTRFTETAVLRRQRKPKTVELFSSLSDTEKPAKALCSSVEIAAYCDKLLSVPFQVLLNYILAYCRPSLYIVRLQDIIMAQCYCLLAYDTRLVKTLICLSSLT